jgi:hypothetical protein
MGTLNVRSSFFCLIREGDQIKHFLFFSLSLFSIKEQMKEFFLIKSKLFSAFEPFLLI